MSGPAPCHHGAQTVCAENNKLILVILYVSIMDIELRSPRPGDIGWLISMHGRLYWEQFKFDSTFEIDIAKKVIYFLTNHHEFNKLWIATNKDIPIGSIAVSLRPEEVAFINFLLVKPDFRGLGVAKKLLNNVKKHSEDHNIKILRLETYSCLKDARNLYKKFGFEVYNVNRHINMYSQSFDQEFWQKII